MGVAGTALHPQGADLLVVAGHLLDHPDDPSLTPVALEVPPQRFPEPVLWRGPGLRVENHPAQWFDELLFDRDRHLTKDLFLGVEVVIEGAVGETGPLGDIRDPPLEETVLLEDLFGRLEQPHPRPSALERARTVRPLALGRG